jgi:hypothetical protein
LVVEYKLWAIFSPFERGENIFLMILHYDDWIILPNV